LKPACKNASIPYFTLHGWRHFYASKLASQGKSLIEIQNSLGHEDAKTTSIYLDELLGILAKFYHILVANDSMDRGIIVNLLIFLEPTGRVELPTSRLRIGCSTTELRRLSGRARKKRSKT